MTEDKKGNADQLYININVLAQDNSKIKFKIKKTCAMKKMMNVYCNLTGLPLPTIRFRLDGIAIDGDHTPSFLKMKDNDTIEIYQRQTGG